MALMARSPTQTCSPCCWRSSGTARLCCERSSCRARFKRPSGVLAPVYDEWWEALAAEPCVAEQELMVRELLEGPGKLRKGMAPR